MFAGHSVMDLHHCYHHNRCRLFIDFRNRTVNPLQMDYNGQISSLSIFHTITKPIWLDADVCFLAFEVICWTGGIAWTAFMRFVWRGIIFAIIDTIAHLWLWNTSAIETGELTIDARRICTTLFIRIICIKKRKEYENKIHQFMKNWWRDWLNVSSSLVYIY